MFLISIIKQHDMISVFLINKWNPCNVTSFFLLIPLINSAAQCFYYFSTLYNFVHFAADINNFSTKNQLTLCKTKKVIISYYWDPTENQHKTCHTICVLLVFLGELSKIYNNVVIFGSIINVKCAKCCWYDDRWLFKSLFEDWKHHYIIM